MGLGEGISGEGRQSKVTKGRKKKANGRKRNRARPFEEAHMFFPFCLGSTVA
jgi:hypothetical protein